MKKEKVCSIPTENYIFTETFDVIFFIVIICAVMLQFSPKIRFNATQVAKFTPLWLAKHYGTLLFLLLLRNETKKHFIQSTLHSRVSVLPLVICASVVHGYFVSFCFNECFCYFENCDLFFLMSYRFPYG